MKKIFITGGTGFLGKGLIKRFISEKGSEVYALVRAGREGISFRKLSLIKACFPENERKTAAKRIHFIRGDISSKNMGISGADLRLLKGKITHAYHCAGMLSFNKKISDIRKVNVEGAKNFLSVMEDWERAEMLVSINHISTAYICGTYTGRFFEDHFDVSQKFNNTYEKSKFEAEKIVEEYRKKGMNINVFRPSLITHLFREGMEEGDLSLKIAKIIRSGLLRMLPMDKKTTINMVPIEIVAEVIYSLSLLPNRVLNKNFHIVNPRPVKQIMLLTILSSLWGFDLPKGLPADRCESPGLTAVQKRLIGPFLPYMTLDHSFDMKNTIELINKYKIRKAYFLIKNLRRDKII